MCHGSLRQVQVNSLCSSVSNRISAWPASRARCPPTSRRRGRPPAALRKLIEGDFDERLAVVSAGVHALTHIDHDRQVAFPRHVVDEGQCSDMGLE